MYHSLLHHERLNVRLGDANTKRALTPALNCSGLQVVMTDVETSVLQNLRSCMLLNTQQGTDEEHGGNSDNAAASDIPNDSDLFDDAESVEEFDMMDFVPGKGRFTLAKVVKIRLIN